MSTCVCLSVILVLTCIIGLLILKATLHIRYCLNVLPSETKDFIISSSISSSSIKMLPRHKGNPSDAAAAKSTVIQDILRLKMCHTDFKPSFNDLIFFFGRDHGMIP